MTLPEWIVDLRARLEQLERITREAAEVGGASGGGYDMVEVILGLLFSPAPTSQRHAKCGPRQQGVVGESVAEAAAQRSQSRAANGKFAIRGLKLQGANWDRKTRRSGSTMAQ